MRTPQHSNSEASGCATSGRLSRGRAGYIAGVDLAAYLGLFRRRWLVLAMCLVAGVTGAISATRSAIPLYSATTRLFVNIPAAGGVSEALQGVQLSSGLLESYAVIATSRTSAAEVASRLDLPSSAQVEGRVKAAAVPETLVLTVTAEDPDPRRAQRLADMTSRVLIDTVAELEEGRADAIQPRIIDLAQLPTAPVSPQPQRNLLIGTVLGLITGVGLAAALEAMDRTVRQPAEVARLLETPLLALVPRRRDAASKPLLDVEDAGTPAAEAYRVLRTAVRFVDLGNPVTTLLVTSAAAGEGKTTTAANLAVALAQAGERVVLVDADLRRTRLGSILGVRSEPGLTSVIIGDRELDEALVRVSDRLSVLPTGPLPPNPSELLGSQAMATLVGQLKTRCDILVFDSPPLLPVTDAQVLSTRVDGVAVVARFGRTRREQLAEARSRLDVVGARVFGCVLNDVPSSAEYTDEYAYAAVASGSGSARWPWRLTGRRGRNLTPSD
jgi:capsular exopolysaccharide synthesis family protein